MNRATATATTGPIAGTVPAFPSTDAPAAGSPPRAVHVIEIDRPVLTPEEGMLLGNGDLSVSVYQAADKIIWRFGKGDVWDRRHDLSEDPKPAHIDEVAHGIEVEGWKCGPYGGPVEATRGTADPQRMRDICQSCPPSYTQRPYPCPKPVGELSLHLPPDLPGLEVRQRLIVEEAKLLIECSWLSGVRLHLEAFVPPAPNVLALRWEVENWSARTRLGDKPPVWFSLYRWADPTIRSFAARLFADCRHEGFNGMTDPEIAPLAPPAAKREAGRWAIEQRFAPDPLFPDGFRYRMTPFVPADVGVERVDMEAVGEARLHILPGQDAAAGQLAVAVATSGDPGGPAAEIERLGVEWDARPAAAWERWAGANRQAAAEFWARSGVAIADPVLENLWYETFHARRCAYRRGTVPPGLYLPSTVRDYAHWHGDYHWNYNFQQPFWGDYTANHLELGDAYFDAMNFALPIGRKIARDYYGCRGAFVQLTTYPIAHADDPLGCVPMGRMAYMTGFAMNPYWWRYLHTRDTEWLRATGYPVLREGALFYADFMKKGEDGLYHIFPSNQGEDGFSGDPRDFTDRAQVMQHARYCLRAAIGASEVLDVDQELRALWRDRLDHAAPDHGAFSDNHGQEESTNPATDPGALSGLEKACYEANPPEFGIGRPYRPQPERPDTTPPAASGSDRWYFAKVIWGRIAALRSGTFVAERDLPAFRRLVAAWRRPNGVPGAMAAANYGRMGIMGESLGVAAPLQEMMLQSWDGALRIFPAWPRALDARFENFRAEGAFLVTAAWSQGEVRELSLRSEKGALCRVYAPWPGGLRVTDSAGNEVPVDADPFGRPQFATRPGQEYRLQPWARRETAT